MERYKKKEEEKINKFDDFEVGVVYFVLCFYAPTNNVVAVTFLGGRCWDLWPCLSEKCPSCKFNLFYLGV